MEPIKCWILSPTKIIESSFKILSMNDNDNWWSGGAKNIDDDDDDDDGGDDDDDDEVSMVVETFGTDFLRKRVTPFGGLLFDDDDDDEEEEEEEEEDKFGGVKRSEEVLKWIGFTALGNEKINFVPFPRLL